MKAETTQQALILINRKDVFHKMLHHIKVNWAPND